MATLTRTFKLLQQIKCRHVTHCVTAGALGKYYDMPFVLLESIVRQRFQLPASSKFTINYTDKDNDEVTIANDGDIYNAWVVQDLNPVRLTVWLQKEESRSSAHDARPPNPLTVDPPPWAVVILLKLDQLLLAVNKLKKPVVAPRGPTSTKIEDHFVVVDDSPVDDSTLKKTEELCLAAAKEVSDVMGRGAESIEVFGSGSNSVAGLVAGPSTIAPNLEGPLGVGQKKGSGARKKKTGKHR